MYEQPHNNNNNQPSNSNNPYYSDPSFSYPPPRSDPFPHSDHYPSNFPGFGAPPVNYSDPCWVIKEAAPVKYSHAIQPATNALPVANEAAFTTSYNAQPDYNLIYQRPTFNNFKKKMKRPKVVSNKASMSQSVQCKLCNIECNNVQVYEKHLSGKKHNKGLLKLYAPALQSAAKQASQSSSSKFTSTDGESNTVVATNPVDLEVKKRKLLEGGTAIQAVRVCSICNIACNGEVAFADHLVGKKHIAQERAIGKAINSSLGSVSTLDTNAQQNLTKKRRTEELALVWCDVCNISCTNHDGLKIHLVGKKHQKNLRKHQISNSSTNTHASTAAPVHSENPSTGVVNTTPVPKPQQTKKKDQPKDVESKKKIVLECGASPNAVRMCTVCGVVCNSEKVFHSHLVGQKHVSMVKRAEAVSASGLQAVYPGA